MKYYKKYLALVMTVATVVSCMGTVPVRAELKAKTKYNVDVKNTDFFKTSAARKGTVALTTSNGYEYTTAFNNKKRTWINDVGVTIRSDFDVKVVMQLHKHNEGWGRVKEFTSTKSASTANRQDGHWIEAIAIELETEGDNKKDLLGNYNYISYKAVGSAPSVSYLKRFAGGKSEDDIREDEGYQKGVRLGLDREFVSKKATTSGGELAGANAAFKSWVGTTGYSLPLTSVSIEMKPYKTKMTLDYNGGKLDRETKHEFRPVDSDTTYKLNWIPVREGYEFDGWEVTHVVKNENPNGKDPAYIKPSVTYTASTDEDDPYKRALRYHSKTKINVGNAKSFTLEAQWKPIYEIQYVKNVQTSLPYLSDDKVILHPGRTCFKGDKLNFDPKIPELAGARFDGWYLGKTSFLERGKVEKGFNFTEAGRERILNVNKLYAKWTDITKPTITTRVPGGGTTQTITGNVVDEGGSGLKIFRLYEGSIPSANKIGEYTVLATGTIDGTTSTIVKDVAASLEGKYYTFYAEDKHGNKKLKRFTVATQDKIPPEINCDTSYGPFEGDSLALNFPVLDDGGSGLKFFGLYKGFLTQKSEFVDNLALQKLDYDADPKTFDSSMDYNFTEEGNYSLIAYDHAENCTIKNFSISSGTFKWYSVVSKGGGDTVCAQKIKKSNGVTYDAEYPVNDTDIVKVINKKYDGLNDIWFQRMMNQDTLEYMEFGNMDCAITVDLSKSKGVDKVSFEFDDELQALGISNQSYTVSSTEKDKAHIFVLPDNVEMNKPYSIVVKVHMKTKYEYQQYYVKKIPFDYSAFKCVIYNQNEK